MRRKDAAVFHMGITCEIVGHVKAGTIVAATLVNSLELTSHPPYQSRVWE
jgi:hypothetical protein